MHMGSFNLQKGNPGKLKMREREMKENNPGGTTGFVSRTIRGPLVIQSCSMDTFNPLLGESSKRWPGIPRSLSLILKNSAILLTDREIISMIKWRSEFTAVTIYKASIQKMWKMLMLLWLASKWKHTVEHTLGEPWDLWKGMTALSLRKGHSPDHKRINWTTQSLHASLCPCIWNSF